MMAQHRIAARAISRNGQPHARRSPVEQVMVAAVLVWLLWRLWRPWWVP